MKFWAVRRKSPKGSGFGKVGPEWWGLEGWAKGEEKHIKPEHEHLQKKQRRRRKEESRSRTRTRRKRKEREKEKEKKKEIKKSMLEVLRRAPPPQWRDRRTKDPETRGPLMGIARG